VEETGGPVENHWQTLSHMFHLSGNRTHNALIA
jgi:hypothetical protein